MKHKAPQFELPGAEQQFNLAGQRITQALCERCGEPLQPIGVCLPCWKRAHPESVEVREFDFSHISSPDPERTHP